MPQLKGARSDCYYGSTGTGKTSNIGQAALWAWQKYKRRTRLVSADGGGWATIQHLVRDEENPHGLIDAWPIRDRTNQIESLDLACQGYWPVNPQDPMSPLTAPFSVVWVATCPQCKKERTSTKPIAQKFAPCPDCSKDGKQVLMPIIMQRSANADNDLGQFALYAFEGLTSFGDLVLNHLQNTGASLSQDPSYAWSDGSITYHGGNMTYYGFTQQRLYDFVMKTNMLPVEKVIWTAMEAKGEDETTKSPIYGPAIAGKKSTGKAGGWFGNLLHFDMAEAITATAASGPGASAEVKLEFRMYLRNHAEALTKIVYPAKTRAPFEYRNEMPQWMEPDVSKLYDKLDELTAKAQASAPSTAAAVEATA